MKTLSTLALCVLCAAGARAVNVEWRGAYDALAGQTLAIEGATLASFSAALVFNLESVPISPSLQTGFMTFAYGSNKQIALGTGTTFASTDPSGQGTQGIYGSQDYWGNGTLNGNIYGANVGLPPFQVGENVLGITFSAPASGATSGTITLWLNGVSYTIKDMVYLSPDRNSAINSVTFGDTMAEALGGQFYYAAAVADAEDFAALVPEPTALALLALGVAGVALRRKAA